jgi:hypothetical protein
MASTEQAVSISIVASSPSDNLLDKEESKNDPEPPYNNTNGVLSSPTDNLLDKEEPDSNTPEIGEPSEPESADGLERNESNNDTEQPTNGLSTASPTDNLLDTEEAENDLPKPEPQSIQESSTTEESGKEPRKSESDGKNAAFPQQRAGNGDQKAKGSDTKEDVDHDKLQDLMMGDEDEPQPLVGYWAWKNSIMTHKMKMHLAKNSDLGLHVVLAILVNQVRYERNAVAMTV